MMVMRRLPFRCAALVLALAPLAVRGQTPPAPPATTPPPATDKPFEVTLVAGSASGANVIAIPHLPTPAAVATAAGRTDVLGAQIAEVMTQDLRGTGLFSPLEAVKLPPLDLDTVAAPAFGTWSGVGASALVTGRVSANGDGTLNIGCYLYDVTGKSELARQGFTVAPRDWRRAAHKCADMAYARLTGEGPYFDSRIVYISETGPKGRRIKRLAIMDQDGANHHFLTNGQNIALTPRLAPNHQLLVYMSYLANRGQIYVYNLTTGAQRLVISTPNLTFAPRLSPDNRYVLFSMAEAGNTNLYRVPLSGGTPERLTSAPGISTGGSYSPDGSKIVFESDRSGTQQLYVMNADGSSPHRISFGDGRYATPAWSPRGDTIAFTKIGGGKFRIGVMSPSGGNERLLSDSWQDEGPSWSPNGRVVTFFRAERGSGRTTLWAVDLTGANEHRIPTPLDASDPSWGALLP